MWCGNQLRPLHREAYLILDKFINIILMVVLSIIVNMAGVMTAAVIKQP